MDERKVFTGITTTGIIGAFGDFYQPLIPFFALALGLVIADLRFGIKAAKARKNEAIKNNQPFEPIRFSRAGRRTLSKLTDYVCWITLAGLIGQTYGTIFGIPKTVAAVLAVVVSFEVGSCFSNYFEARGKKVKVNVWNFLTGKNKFIEFEEETIKTNDNGNNK